VAAGTTPARKPRAARGRGGDDPGVAAPSIAEVTAFLAERHAGDVTGVERLGGGFWSAAFGYRAGGRALVVRFGPIGYEADRDAMAYDGPDLPVPEVLEIGEAFGGAYAISVRHFGGFLEDVDPRLAETAGETVTRLLGALYAVGGDGGSGDWRATLLDGFVDDRSRRVSGWRATLAADPELDRLFDACEARVRALAEACPQRRDLLHADLLHGNVLVTADAARVTAVFSWKCSMRGDFLYDTAWCTFWGPFHPGIEAAGIWPRVLAAPWANADPAALVDAATRHHCYELEIGASHLAWNAWTGDAAALRDVAARTADILERGPLAAAAADPDGATGELR
jgi:aminoglycoside phosphotransferase (APT) family kinase protein